MAEKNNKKNGKAAKISKLALAEIRKQRGLIKDALYEVSHSKSYFKENVVGIQKLIKELDKMEKEAQVKHPKAPGFASELKGVVGKRIKRKPLEKAVEEMTQKKEKKEAESEAITPRVA